MDKRIVLIRHGLTESNVKGKYAGHQDDVLSKEGEAQAAKLKDRFKDIIFDRVYCSDRKRAIRTAEIIFGDLPVIKEKGLSEINFGVFEGLTHQEIMEKYTDIYKKCLEDPFNVSVPGAETMNGFQERVTGTIKKIVSPDNLKNVALVCHGGTIAIFIHSILKDNNFWRHIPGNATVTAVKYRNGEFSVESFNE
jgi:broad specificity phosphatase PhoE